MNLYIQKESDNNYYVFPNDQATPNTTYNFDLAFGDALGINKIDLTGASMTVSDSCVSVDKFELKTNLPAASDTNNY